MLKKISLAALLIFSLTSCKIFEVLGPVGPLAPTQLEINSALKEALQISIENAVIRSSKEHGFYANPKIRIPFPPEAQRAANTLKDLGMGMVVDNFVETMNYGAEKAAAKATPIFKNAITSMTFADVYGIYRGDHDAATVYLRSKTTSDLKKAFRPEIDNSLQNVGVTKYWEPVVSTYNKIPFVQPIETDLTEYVLNRTLDGLFKLMAEEEVKIREDPAARVTVLLERVFGFRSQEEAAELSGS